MKNVCLCMLNGCLAPTASVDAVKEEKSVVLSVI
jgi:hypothetical protein